MKYVCSSSKTLGVHSSEKNSLHTEHNHIISIHMDNHSLLNKISNSSVFFFFGGGGGKLNCIPHITYIIERSIGIIISVANYPQQSWGGDRTTLQRVC